MAKDLRSKMVLDLGDFRSSLSAAERETRRTVAAIERDSKTSITSIRGGLLGGIGSGNSVAELRAYQREQMGISGGPDARYTGMFGATQRRSGDYDSLFSSKPMGLESTVKLAAQAAAAITVLDVATKTWNGDLQGAAETIKKLPFGLGQVATMLESVIGSWTGWSSEIAANEKAVKDIEESSRKVNERLRKQIAYEKEAKDRIREIWSDATAAGMDGYSRTLFDNARSERNEIQRASRARDNIVGAVPDQKDKWDAWFRKEADAIETKYIAINRAAMWADADARMAEKERIRSDEERKKSEAEKNRQAEITRDAERRERGQEVLRKNTEAQYLERQQQSRYDPMGGNAALESQTLTRVPGTGNVATVEDRKMIAESRGQTRELREIRRVLERNQLAAAEL